jgi:hypothetical protein
LAISIMSLAAVKISSQALHFCPLPGCPNA